VKDLAKVGDREKARVSERKREEAKGRNGGWAGKNGRKVDEKHGKRKGERDIEMESERQQRKVKGRDTPEKVVRATEF